MIVTTASLNWEVIAYRFADEQSAGEAWEAIYNAAMADPEGDVSVWRTTTPERDLWLVVLCGKPERVAKYANPAGGTEFEISEGDAYRFALRRARVGADEEKKNPLAESVQQQAHYEGGARIGNDGGVTPHGP